MGFDFRGGNLGVVLQQLADGGVEVWADVGVIPWEIGVAHGIIGLGFGIFVMCMVVRKLICHFER